MSCVQRLVGHCNSGLSVLMTSPLSILNTDFLSPWVMCPFLFSSCDCQVSLEVKRLQSGNQECIEAGMRNREWERDDFLTLCICFTLATCWHIDTRWMGQQKPSLYSLQPTFFSQPSNYAATWGQRSSLALAAEGDDLDAANNEKTMKFWTFTEFQTFQTFQKTV